jgi:FAD/FMN-containing dehydrogenase
MAGACIPISNEIILSMSKMNKIHHFDNASGVVTCESGVVLQELDTYLGTHGHRTPLDLGAKGLFDF